MCGILGLKKDAPFKAQYPNLIELNQKRGSASKVMFETPNGTFHHFRAPTSGCDLNNLSEAYPLTYKGFGLIGNGVINSGFFNSIRDEDNHNDLYYILKNVVEKDYEFLEKVNGCFALVFFHPDGTINIVKNTFPLHYSKNIFSSIEFEGSAILPDGVVWDWTNQIVKQNLKLKESPFLI